MGKSPAKSESGCALYLLCMGKNGDHLHKARGNRQQGIQLSLGLCGWLWWASLHCWCNFCLTLIRKVMKALSLLIFEEPFNSGGMLGSIQVVDFSGSEWKWYEKKLRLILFGSWVKSEEHLGAYSVELRDLLNGLLGGARLSSHGTKRQEPKGRIPGASAASLDAFGERWMLYGLPCSISSLSPYLFIPTPYFTHLLALASVSPVLFFHSPPEKGDPEVLLEGADTCRGRQKC